MKKISFGLLFAFMLSVTGPLCFGFGRTLGASKNEALTAENKLEQSLGSRAGQLEIDKITSLLFTELKAVNDENKRLKEELQREKEKVRVQQSQPQAVSQPQNSGQTIRGLWKKLNKPPGWNANQYQNATPDQIKAAWRKYHQEQQRIQMENSR